MREGFLFRSPSRPWAFRVAAAAAVAALLCPPLPSLGAEGLELPAESGAREEVLSTPTTFEAGGEGSPALRIQSRPEGARVYVDGEERGVTPVEVRDLGEGSHVVILYLAGYGAYRQSVRGGGGRVFVDLESEHGLGIGFVSVETEPPDVRVEVDGRRVGLSPTEIPLEAGRHSLVLTRAGFKGAEATVEVEPDGRHRVEVRLTPEEGALLVISSPAGAEVFLDGRSVGRAPEPLRIEAVAPGLHEVRVEKEGFRPWQRSDLSVRSAETTTVLAALVPERDYSWVRLYTDPPGARVWLDGAELGEAGEDGLGFKAAKGVHSLRLEVDPAALPGFRPLEVAVNFTDDEVDYKASPLRLPPVDENLTNARRLIERGQKEEALGFLGRVPPNHPGYGEARLLAIEALRDLGRTAEIPGELSDLLALPENRSNPVLNTALGYWSLMAARDAEEAEGRELLIRALEALDRAVQSAELFPPDRGGTLLLRIHYYTAIASEILFNLTGEGKYVTKGGQAWEVFFARLDLTPDALEEAWIEKARNHRQSLEYLAKKLGG